MFNEFGFFEGNQDDELGYFSQEFQNSFAGFESSEFLFENEPPAVGNKAAELVKGFPHFLFSHVAERGEVQRAFKKRFQEDELCLELVS